MSGGHKVSSAAGSGVDILRSAVDDARIIVSLGRYRPNDAYMWGQSRSYQESPDTGDGSGAT